MLLEHDFVVDIKELDSTDKKVVGESLSSLGQLSVQKVSVMPQIVITPYAFSYFLDVNNLNVQIKHLLGSINHDRHDSISQVAKYIQKLILHGEIPKEIITPLFKKVEKQNIRQMNLEAYCFHGVHIVGNDKWEGIMGESVLAEQIRFAWANLYSLESIQKHLIHHNNFPMFKAALSVIPVLQFEINGTIKTFGHKKAEYEIEAYSMVKFVYNKHTAKLEKGHILPGGDKLALSPHDLKVLLEYAKEAEKALLLPQVLYWGKFGGHFLIKRVSPASDIIINSDTYNTLIKSITVNPGITIGKLKVIDEKSRTELAMNDEIIKLKKLDRGMLSVIKTAKGIIIEEEPHPEVLHLLKSFGIPTVIRKDKTFLYSTGDVVSLDATTGEIKRGSMLVS